MKKGKIKKIISWIAIVISLTTSSFWSYWGIQEFFHEGWYSRSIGNMLFLFFVQYMSFTIIFTALALVTITYKKAGLILYILVGIFSAFFFNGASFEVTYLTLAIPFILLGLLFYYGEFIYKRTIKWIMIGLPLLIIIIFGTPLLIRNINRLDDGNYNTRILDCQDKQIVWAPRGYGFPNEGVNWSEAKKACARLSENGQILLKESANIWRLPSVKEAVMCQQKHSKNAGGVWDEQSRQARYKLPPDKETPLWQPNSEIIYYWTAEVSQETDEQAYIFTYDGKIYDKDIRYAPNYQSFRCVKDYTDDREENNSSYFP